MNAYFLFVTDFSLCFIDTFWFSSVSLQPTLGLSRHLYYPSCKTQHVHQQVGMVDLSRSELLLPSHQLDPSGAYVCALSVLLYIKLGSSN